MISNIIHGLRNTICINIIVRSTDNSIQISVFIPVGISISISKLVLSEFILGVVFGDDRNLNGSGNDSLNGNGSLNRNGSLNGSLNGNSCVISGADI